MRQLYGHHRTSAAVFLTLCIFSDRANAQTKIDLAAQSRNVDFSAAPSTRPFKTGLTLPATCNVGEMFFKTNSTAGSNMYGCAEQDVWTIQAGSNAASLSTGDLRDFAPSLAAGVLTIQPGRIRFGSVPCATFTVSATAFVASGSGDGLAELYVSDSCAIVLEYPGTLTLSFSQGGVSTLNGVTAAAVATPSVPPGAFYLAEVLVQAGVIASVTDKRSVASVFSAAAGPGITVDCATGPCLFSMDSATVPQLGGNNVFTGTEDARNSAQTFPSRHAASDSPTCTVGEQYFNTTSNTRKDCTAPNTWTASSTPPPQSIIQASGNNVYTGTEDARNAQQTFPSKHAASNPTSCVVGEQYFNTTINARLDCTASNTWTPVGGVSGAGGSNSGSSGSVFQRIDAQTSVITQTTATETVLATSVVTSISTGKCIKWTWAGWTTSSALTVKIWYGNSSFTIASGNFGSGNGDLLWGYVCNNQGVQDGQTMSASWGQNGWGGIALVNTTAFVDSSSPQNLKLTAAGSAIVNTQVWTVEGVN